ncbi:chemotaxis protein [Trinickia dabaoshanensis]|uniref:Chemotaxis protein n=1 Tax=Trinickia dabaoshanensis TaxID=564714 RepID=A0A2N7VD94_9BURK|nr:CheR family methyltransferase [Trinickia dabaoshanensis]PMS15097.1 chemotaxis protein [Trinickia dabaoshanensis]
MSDQSLGRSAPNRFAFPTVGIDASAGDIEALKQFFDIMPAQSGAAFVIVLRAPAEPVQSLVTALQPATVMPVVPVRQTTRMEPNHVYLVEPPMVCTIVEHELRTSGPRDADERRHPVDLFFDSLATAYGERAVGVLFASVSTDSAFGFTRLKEFGGVTFAQSRSAARTDNAPWPPSVVNSIDFQLDAAEMPQRMLELWANAKKIRLARVPAGRDELEQEAGEPGAGTGNVERTLREIMMILRNRTGHDFRHYKRATVLRRIERRLQVNGLSDLQPYRDYLQTHPEETTTLLQDMLISVTNFFRDKDAYDILKDQVIPSIFENRRQDEPVRVWVVGCATGEEAYTVAMLLQEASASTRDQVPFQVFATDISERAIATAREGLYPASIAADVDANRLRQFFTKDGEHYRVKKDLRERVLFALHNVLSDPPFSRLDLVCCRNLLIYLDREAQIDTLRTFHFALRPNAHLFLGSSETADSVGGLFSVVDKKTRVYRASIAVRADTPVPIAQPGALNARPPIAHVQPMGKRKFSFGELHQRVVEQHAPPSVLVNRDSDIVHLSERAGRFLQYVGGEPSHNVLTVVRRELRLELRSAIYQALQSEVSVESRRVRLDRDGRSFFVKMTARPVHDSDANADFVLILFDEVEDSVGDVDEAPPEHQRDPIIAQLERELQRTREQLQATIEHSETSTEELKASNEELQAINEELRSATEELETSKEELQAINEELTTVNAELKAKVEETSKINDDLQNLVMANDIGTIFVDRNLSIKRYTPRATDVFSIIATDIGRSLLDITHRLEYDKLADDAAEAFGSLRLIERELKSTDGRWYLARILPYRTTENRIDGAVLSFIDITSRRAAEERLRKVGQAGVDEIERRRDEFLAVVSHELKHPLNLISASTELIGRSGEARSNPTIARAADTIRRTVLGQAQIIDDLLDMSRMRTGKLSITRRPVDLKEVVQRISHTMQDEAQRKDIDFRLSVPDGPVAIHADLTRVEQIVWNLISNALKFTEGDGKITVQLSLDEHHAVLSISDNGIGIDGAALPTIFEMFEQSRSSTSAVRGGLGIGLSLVKDLVAVHGGEVNAHSDGIGHGATFTVRLPRVVEAVMHDGSGTSPTTFLKGEHVMLVDDDHDTVETFRMLLEMEGATVTVATSGEEALDMVGKQQPSLILSDLGMPGMSGLAFIEAVRQRPELGAVKAIALSGFGRPSDVEEATRAGFDAHLTKPVMLDALLSAIARVRVK